MQAQAMSHPPAAVLDGPKANPLGSREPGTYGAATLDDAVLLRARRRGRRVLSWMYAGPTRRAGRSPGCGGAAGVAPAGDTASRAPMDVPFADPLAAAEGHATQPTRTGARAGGGARPSAGRAAIRGSGGRGRVPARRGMADRLDES